MPTNKAAIPTSHAASLAFYRWWFGGKLQVAFLLVHPLSGEGAKEKWILPKGHINPCETSLEASIRELREETGYAGRVYLHQKLGIDFFTQLPTPIHGLEAVECHTYLIEVDHPEEEPLKGEKGREPSWFHPSEAIKAASFPTIQTRIAQAIKLLNVSEEDIHA